MPIETFGGIAELNPSYPPTSDGLVGGDDHIRGIKAAVKASFPNITDPVTATSDALNAAAALPTNGVSKLADAGAKFKTNDKDGFENPSAGKVTVTAQDGSAVKQTVVEVSGADKSVKFNGPLKGGTGQLVPIGGTLIWWEDTLPSEGGYAWANGGKVNVADCPVMASKAFWQARFTDGGTKIQLPDMREVVPIGNSTMGATAARGIITHILSGLSTIAGVIGAATHVLTTGQMPKHKHNNTVSETAHAHALHAQGDAVLSQYPGSASGLIAYYTGLSASKFGAGKALDIGFTDNATAGVAISNVDAGNDEAHNNVQPSAVVNYIIRVG